MEEFDLCGALEAILFIAGEPVRLDALAQALGVEQARLEETAEQLKAAAQRDGRGIRLNRHGAEVQLSINPAYSKQVELFLQPVKKQTLSQAVLETLSIIAYKQPVTKTEIEAIRGVKCDYSIQLLIARGLIEERGRRETLGRPIEYGTTDKFLEHFGIENLRELPGEEGETEENQ